jgi:hypothetical protein
MKTFIYTLILVLAAAGGYLLLKDYSEVEYVTVADEEVDLKFEYRESPDGYVLEDISLPDSNFIKGYLLMLESDYEELQASTEPREGPPTISINVFKNNLNQNASVWIDQNPTYSNINLILGEADRDHVLGGANAVRYRADGLYVSEVVVVAHNGLIYVFSGAFLEEDSTIRRDFQPLLDSVEFIP